MKATVKPLDKEDEDDEDDATKHMTAEQAKESKQLNQLNDNDLQSIRPDERLALEAKIFVTLEAQEQARRIEKEKELASVKITPGVVELLMEETRLNRNEAEKMLRMNKGNLKATYVEYAKAFPHIQMTRAPTNVLGL